MLKFKMSELKPIIEHSEQAPAHKPLYGQQTPVPAGLWLVKDEGVYLMSNGNPVQKNPAHTSDPDNTASQLLVAYANGHNPKIGSTSEADRAECGGDDFGEFIEIAPFRKALDNGFKYVTIKMNKRSFRIGFTMR